MKRDAAHSSSILSLPLSKRCEIKDVRDAGKSAHPTALKSNWYFRSVPFLVAACFFAAMTTLGFASDPVRDVTFSVDMGVLKDAGKFDPDTMGVKALHYYPEVEVALSREGNTAIYSGTVPVAGQPGSNMYYRFNRTDGSYWGWSEYDFREFTLGPTGTAQSLPTAHFDNRESNVVNFVDFFVDVSVLQDAGTFNSETMTVEVRGEFNRWTGGFALDPMDASLYFGTYAVTGWPGDRYEYQFNIAGDGAPGPETIPRRSFIQGADGAGQEMPNVFFNDRGPDVTVDVVFAVDMKVQWSAMGFGGRFDPETMGVEVRGDFNGWSEGTALTDENGDGIYTSTVSVAGWQNQPYEYRFFGSGPDGLGWELLGNRSFILGPASAPQVLPTVFFNDQDESDPFLFVADITCSVDMSVQIAKGYFDPAWMSGVTVELSDFPWSQYPLAREGTSGIYSGTFSVTGWEGRVYGYRFRGGAMEWPLTRSFILGGEGEPVILPTVYYNDEPPPVTQDYVFSVDMGVQIADGRFNPDTMGVAIGDEIFSYTGRVALARQGSSSIYSGTVPISHAPGAELRYAFYGTGENALGREGGRSRFLIFTPTNGPIIMPLMYFNQESPPVYVTFSVDMGPQMDFRRFNPDTMGVEVRGDFNGWLGGSALVRQSNSTIYSGTFPVPTIYDYSEGKEYLFHVIGEGGLGSETNSNRFFSLAWDDPPKVLSTVYFNDQNPPVWVPVTFSVNVSRQVQLGTFDPNTMSMEVRGNFNDWSGGSTLAYVGTNNVHVYSGTLSMPVADGATNEIGYLFYGTGGLELESRSPRTVEISPTYINSHSYYYPSIDLETAYFNDEKPIFTSEVTFSVDMGPQMTAGRFDPSTMGVTVINSASTWGGDPATWPPGAGPLTRQGTSTVYSTTFTVSGTAQWPTYYFVLSGAGSGNGEHDTRTYCMVCEDPHLVLPTTFYKNELPPVFVVFSVDMSVQMASGRFNPNTMTVGMDGTVNDWNYHSPSPLVREGQTAVYSARYPVLPIQGGSDRVDYLFVISDTNGNWQETNAVRSYVLGPPGEDMVLPKAYFNSLPPSAPFAVTFSIDMSVQMAAGNFDPNTQGVEIRGDFNNWTGEWVLAREGSSGIYSGTFTCTGVPGSEMFFLFKIAGADGLGPEYNPPRSFDLPTTGSTLVLPTVFFKNQAPSIPPTIAGLGMVSGQLNMELPSGYSLSTVYGADLKPLNGAWNWQPLVQGQHYSLSNSALTLILQSNKLIRLGLTQNQ